ncbi:MAG: hypothetical protein JXB62_13390 [Pirellulales bacterium]|nr:hypothetical protein [Pirellulales bacterium]
MRKMQLATAVLLAVGLLAVGGCVELTGQRIAWFYDTAADELQVLIHYDGIHDSGGDQHGKGADQIPEFVAAGDVMVLDWPFRFQMADARAKLEDENADPREKAWAGLVASIKTQTVGYYREPDGRVGAAQLLTIPKATDFVRRLNALIDREIQNAGTTGGGSRARTWQRVREAAQNGHEWVRLDGQAIRVTIPVHAGEWAATKAEFLEDTAQHVAKSLADDAKPEQRRGIAFAIQALSTAPLSYVDEGEQVQFVLGSPKKPSTLRISIRDEYEPSLETVVAESVKTDLDGRLADVLLEENAKPSGPLAAVLNWGPPEEQVRALVAAAESGDSARQAAAMKRLEAWGAKWNRERGVPEAIETTANRDEALAAWRAWYETMRPDTAPRHNEAEKPDE